jgi:hypothetical protein
MLLIDLVRMGPRGQRLPPMCDFAGRPDVSESIKSAC